MRLKVALFGGLGLLLAATPLKAALSVEEVVGHIQEEYNRTQDLTAHFVQKAYNKAMNQTQTATGTVYIKKPGQMRWDYDSPQAQVFIMNQEKFWWYTPQSKQVIVKPAREAFDSHLPLAFISGVGSLRQDFNIQFAPDQPQTKEVYTLELVPKQPQVNLKKMWLKVDKKNYRIQEVVMYDFYGNITTLEFSQHKLNTGLKTSIFQFEPPLGVQVIQ